MSGGRHIIFKYPKAQKLRNSAGNLLGSNIDTRGEGGYIIWAGSKTELGAYTYRVGYTPEEVGFSELPERLLNILLSKERKVHSSQDDKATIENGTRNETLFQEAVTLVHSGVSEQDIRDRIEARAKACVERLDSSELENILTSALRYRKSSCRWFKSAPGHHLIKEKLIKNKALTCNFV